MLQKSTLFEARKGGYKTFRVPGILATPIGTVVVTAEARPGAPWQQRRRHDRQYQ